MMDPISAKSFERYQKEEVGNRSSVNVRSLLWERGAEYENELRLMASDQLSVEYSRPSAKQIANTSKYKVDGLRSTFFHPEIFVCLLVISE